MVERVSTIKKLFFKLLDVFVLECLVLAVLEGVVFYFCKDYDISFSIIQISSSLTPYRESMFTLMKEIAVNYIIIRSIMLSIRFVFFLSSLFIPIG